MDIDRLEDDAQTRGLRLTTWQGSEVVNVTTPGREMTREDVETFRAILAEHGLEEVQSWVATQGMSWLSDGVFAGVSFRVTTA